MTRSTLKDFEVLSRLGSGSFGTVFRVRRIIDDGVYVIKTVRIVELSYKEQTEAINEVQILAQLKSPYVVRYYDSFIEKDSLHIVMEFCNRGDLQNLIRKAKEKNVAGLKENVIWNIAIQVMLGLHYLHKKHILHRDLKSANVFLMKDESKTHYLVKIGDLGVAKLMDTSTALANTIVGTPYYLSPELCMDMPYRDKSDCWAFGVLVYESCTLEHPFEARNQCALIMKIIEAVVQPPPQSSASKELRNLILWLLQKDPNFRPSIKDILCEDFVREKMAEHRFDVPAELQDAPITNNLLEKDFERDQQSRKRRSSVKVLSEISNAQAQAQSAVEAASEGHASAAGAGIAYNEAAAAAGSGAAGSAGSGSAVRGNGNKAPPRQGSESPVSGRRAAAAASGAAGRANRDRSASPPPQQQFMVAGSALKGKSSRNLDTDGNAGGGGAVRHPARHSPAADSKHASEERPPPVGNFLRGQSKKLDIVFDDDPTPAAGGDRTGDMKTTASEDDVANSQSIDEASQTFNAMRPDNMGHTVAVRGGDRDNRNNGTLLGNRAESKTPSDYEDEEFEAYESMTPLKKGATRGAHVGGGGGGGAAGMAGSPLRQSFKAEVEDLEDDGDARTAPSRAHMLAAGNRGKSSKELDADAADTLSAQSSPFRDTTSSSLSVQNMHISSTSTSNWDPVWTQGRGVIEQHDHHTGPGHNGGRGGPGGLQRTISDTADFAMGPLRTDSDSAAVSRLGKLDEGMELKTSEGVEPPSNEEIGALQDLIEEARSKAINSLGLTVYRKVYDLCAKHMNSPAAAGGGDDTHGRSHNSGGVGAHGGTASNSAGEQEGVGGAAHIGTDERGDPTIEPDSEPTLPFITELEKLLCDQNDSSGATIEMACEAVFGIKLLLALESKYESHAKHANE